MLPACAHASNGPCSTLSVSVGSVGLCAVWTQCRRRRESSHHGTLEVAACIKVLITGLRHAAVMLTWPLLLSVVFLQPQAIQPVNGDPFVGFLETPVTSNPEVRQRHSTCSGFGQQRGRVHDLVRLACAAAVGRLWWLCA